MVPDYDVCISTLTRTNYMAMHSKDKVELSIHPN